MDVRARLVMSLTTYAEACKETLSEIGLVAYETSLIPRYSIDQIERALVQMMLDRRYGKYLPKPIEIAEFIDGSNSEGIDEAWAKVKDAVSGVGKYRSVVFDDARIHVAITRMGGWITLCSKLDDYNEKVLRETFTDIFANSAGQPWPSHLIGETEAAAKRSGLKLPIPIVYGDQEKAVSVYTGAKVAAISASSGNANQIGQLVSGIGK